MRVIVHYIDGKVGFINGVIGSFDTEGQFIWFEKGEMFATIIRADQIRSIEIDNSDKFQENE